MIGASVWRRPCISRGKRCKSEATVSHFGEDISAGILADAEKSIDSPPLAGRFKKTAEY